MNNDLPERDRLTSVDVRENCFGKSTDFHYRVSAYTVNWGSFRVDDRGINISTLDAMSLDQFRHMARLIVESWEEVNGGV